MADGSIPSFKAADLVIELSSALKAKQDRPVFGNVFTDHMLTIEWSASEGWQAPLIKPFGNLTLHPACSSLHYGAFDQSELLKCIRRLVEIEQDWVPHSESSSLYIRPTFLGTEQSLGVKKASKALLYVILCPVGSYFTSETKSLSLWADPKYTRAWKGGTGNYKMGGNYGCSLFAQYEAEDHGCQQVLWLYGEDHQITEAGTMNIFLHWINEDGEEELATPPLDGIILPGVTRQSILELTRRWGEFKVTERYLTMSQLCSALKQLRVKELFGSGTACMVCPIGHIVYQGENLHIPCQEKDSQLASRIAKELVDIQHGRTPSDWTLLV
ncbi:Branched-chain-amino-acid aminotransferase, cytosolic [Liparis tanakae]|uniref:Branched-chain-amino-acid aminotransferase n=1 Tax=Liparis tanakae TaxID=230148 RepID=A0A4Z2G8A5_9TELE|nr:Branched-chain-amino-acid aminotransferase, cytosolic [Liparis tanakae]